MSGDISAEDFLRSDDDGWLVVPDWRLLAATLFGGILATIWHGFYSIFSTIYGGVIFLIESLEDWIIQVITDVFAILPAALNESMTGWEDFAGTLGPAAFPVAVGIVISSLLIASWVISR